MRLRQLWIMVLIVVTLGGCASIKCNYNGKVYENSDEAMKVYRADLSDRLAGIKPTENRKGGRALIVLPSQKLLTDIGLAEPANLLDRDKDDFAKYFEYVTARSDAHLGFMADALKKRGIFDEVVIIRSDSPEKSSPAGYDYLIYMSVPAAYQDQWYMRAGNNAPTPIFIDYTIERSSERDVKRTIAWLTSTEQLASEVR